MTAALASELPRAKVDRNRMFIALATAKDKANVNEESVAVVCIGEC